MGGRQHLSTKTAPEASVCQETARYPRGARAAFKGGKEKKPLGPMWGKEGGCAGGKKNCSRPVEDGKGQPHVG